MLGAIWGCNKLQRETADLIYNAHILSYMTYLSNVGIGPVYKIIHPRIGKSLEQGYTRFIQDSETYANK